MKSLLSSPVSSILSYWQEFNSTVKNIKSFPVEIEGLQGAASSFFVASFIDNAKSNLLYISQYAGTGRYAQEQQKSAARSVAGMDALLVVQNEKTAMDVACDLRTAFEDAVEVYNLPWWGLVPYRATAKGARVFGERAGVLALMASQGRMMTQQTKPRIFIVSQRALQTPVPAPEYIKGLIFSLHKGKQVEPTDLADDLAYMGYIRVPKVSAPGEFTLRGEVMDIFTPGEELPTRILFDFDTIESLKTFSVETQATVGLRDGLLVYPMKEVIWDDELISSLEKKFDAMEKGGAGQSLKDDFGDFQLSLTEKAREAKEKFLDEIKACGESEGEELFYPVLWEKKYTVLDYISPETPVFFFDYERLLNAQENFDREYFGLYRKARQEFPVFYPREVLVPFDEIFCLHEKRIIFKTLHTQETQAAEELSFGGAGRIKIDCEPSRSFFGNIKYLKDEITAMQNEGWKIFVFADNENQALRINEILKNFGNENDDSVDKTAQLAKKSVEKFIPYTIFPKAITSGFSVDAEKLIVIQENEIFGRKKQAPKSLHHVKSEAIETFVDLNEGDYVVHTNYGIGIFKGIERIKSLGMERDYIELEYADEEYVYVPIEQVNLVQRYIGNNGDNPRLDKIGSKAWENRKNKVRKEVEDMAEKLIALYSKRKASRGFPFPKDSEWQTAFEASFPYEDTPDQYTVTQEIKADMEKPVPMDRLLCGDVGYGKTEISMRAAFKAVMGGKQVAFLAPTTILAEQHYETCVERFQNFPVTIAQMSRFVSAKEQKQTLERLAKGEIDILIGTHRIIQKDVVFRDLGLMIIDEEQRFGVKDKEKLKSLKANIDSLAMSATPIPRTLHMSLLKIRDMSLLTTPPQTRKPIETVIDEYTDERVASAIRREVERGGQVFFLHNRVETLDETRRKLEKIVPEMMIDVAHGQMSAEELDDIFRRFKMGGFHVLVATTIIENGIDIPNVNTIIIDRADMYGVSQLYQLRGRVGRSDKKAYAYLLYPENKALSEVAMKRLQVISDFTELGSGFKIAMKDMEIRGAGNLLGRDQSGEVYSVGFDMYMKLLNEAVERLTKENYEEQSEVLMELEYTGFIPDSYIPNTQTKMEIYKKVAGIQTRDELERMMSELEDRFGPVPDEVYSLLSLAEVRIIAKKLFIRTLKEKNGLITAEFSKVSNINVDKVIKMMVSSHGKVKLDPARPNVLMLSTGKIGLKEKSQFIREQLEHLMVEG
ncbi:MAG: transcription-repair coupling factor [Treponema sp.]|nr:transcription-repair coupling factor [Treponema sp.]